MLRVLAAYQPAEHELALLKYIPVSRQQDTIFVDSSLYVSGIATLRLDRLSVYSRHPQKTPQSADVDVSQKNAGGEGSRAEQGRYSRRHR